MNQPSSIASPSSQPLTSSVAGALGTVLLLANLAIYVGYGAGFLAAPQALASHLDITLGSTTALADFRAMYGGLCLACAAVFALGLRSAAWRQQALELATLGAGGLALGRVVTMVVDGMPGPLMLALLASEVGAVAIGAFILLAKPARKG